MCFHVHKNHKKAKITKKDKIVYKAFKCKRKNKFISPYRNFVYEKGACYYEDSMKVIKSRGTVKGIIRQGLHSLAKRGANGYIFRDYIIVKCIIPRGAKYYYDPSYQEYVSDYLIIGTNKDIISYRDL